MKRSRPPSSRSGTKKPNAAPPLRPRRGKDREPFAGATLGRTPSARERSSKKEQTSPDLEKAIAATKRRGVLLWGVHAVREAWLNPVRACLTLWGTEGALDQLNGAFVKARADGITRPQTHRADRDWLDGLVPPGSVHQGVVLEVMPLGVPTLEDVIHGVTAPDIIVVLDQVTDPHNVGAVMRSAAAFGAGAVIMTERGAAAMTGTLAKAASGAAEHVAAVPVVNLARALDQLRKAGYWCIGLAEEASRPLAAMDLKGKIALVLGGEGNGLRRLTRDHCDDLARLPTGGPIGSLNVSNAAAIALYEAKRQRGA